MKIKDEFKGKTLEEVQSLWKNGSVRISKIDGKYCVLTRDLNPHRLNVVLENGIVVDWHTG